MTRQEFITVKIRETQDSINSSRKYLETIQHKPIVKANYERFIAKAEASLERYYKGALNESEEYRLFQENDAASKADLHLFLLHNGSL